MADGRAKRRAVFLDRDGTVIEERGDLGDPDNVALIPGAGRAIRRLNEAGLAVVLVTNQSGIAKGLFSRRDFEAVQSRMIALLAEGDARLDGSYLCPHHPDVDGPCDCRKPGAGLYRQAAEELNIDLARSFYVGDRWRDVAVAERLGGMPLLVRTGAGGRDAPPGIERVDDLAGAVDRVLGALEEES